MENKNIFEHVLQREASEKNLPTLNMMNRSGRAINFIEERIKYMRNLNSSIDQAVKSVLFNHSPKKQEKYTQEIIDNYDTFTK